MDSAVHNASYNSINFVEYDVFISFRGEDTRKNFTDHLYKALCGKQIKVYMDEKSLGKGEEISSTLFLAIQKSKISLVIISENYAFSTWCLNELSYILKCKEENGQIVVPIFYDVDPSHVRKQVGSFAHAFVAHQGRFEDSTEQLHEWKTALKKACALSGWDSRHRYESTLIEEIVEYVVSTLNYSSSRTIADFEPSMEGIDRQLKKLEFAKTSSHASSDFEARVQINRQNKKHEITVRVCPQKGILANGRDLDMSSISIDYEKQPLGRTDNSKRSELDDIHRKASMEELHLAAKANYLNSSRNFQNQADDFFKSLNTSGKRRVIGFDDFNRFVRQNGYSWINSDMFAQLDANNDGSLDFWEALTLYYIVNTRNIACDGCRGNLHGLYFTCATCFDGASNTCDLCSRCYGGRNFRHNHHHFLDSYVLLLSKRGTSPGTHLACTQPQNSNQSTRGIGVEERYSDCEKLPPGRTVFDKRSEQYQRIHQNTNMEELRLAAQAYYRNSSSGFQDLATKFFKSMDTNGDGRVSLDEFSRFLRHSGYNWVNTEMFALLDANNDGGLDFWEVLTFYYIVKTRTIVCNGCYTLLAGLYFTCVACFDRGSNSTYSLCPRCYGDRNFSHDHWNFSDSYALLRSKRRSSRGTNRAVIQPQNGSQSSSAVQPQNGSQSSSNQWFRAMELAVDVGNEVGCSVM